MHVKITNIIELAGNVKEPQRLQEKLLKFIYYYKNNIWE